MTTKYGIYTQKILKRGKLYEGTECVWEWEFNPYWGIHDSRNAAKVRWCREMFTDFNDCDDEALMVRAFNSQLRNEKLAKVMPVKEEQYEQVSED